MTDRAPRVTVIAASSLAGLGPDVEVIVTDPSPTRSTGRQVAWTRARAPIVVFLEQDDDGELALAMTSALEDADVDVIAAPPSWMQPALDEAFRARPQSADVAFCVLGRSFAVRRTALELTTGFNPCTTRFEEVELAVRLWERGARFGRMPSAAETERRWLADEEMQALFWRCPYLPLLRVHAWALGRTEPGFDIPSCEASEETLANHFAAIDGVEHSRLHQWLAAGVARGLHHEVVDGKVMYPAAERITDWLRDTTPYLETAYRKDLGRALFRPDPALEPGRVLHCRARYRLRVDPALAASAGIDRVNVPIPESSSRQRELRLEHAEPPSLRQVASDARGMVMGFPLASEISYEVTFQVDAPMRAQENEIPPADHLRATLPTEQRQRAESLLRHLRVDDPFKTARRIYDWLQSSVLFGAIPPRLAYHRVLDLGAGVCIQQIRLLVSLCRLAGIPAREVSGAVLQPGDEDQPASRRVTVTRGFSPFVHTWAEIYVTGNGWVPMEVQGYGKRGICSLTIPDEHLRTEIQRVLYERYPFGTLHPYRVIVGAAANRIGTFTPSPGIDPAALRRLMEATEHEVECLFEVPPSP